MTSRRTRRIAVGMVLVVLSAAQAPGSPRDHMTWASHFTPAPSLFEPAETPGLITPFMFLYALHDGLVKPMPGKIMTPSLAESWTASADGLVYEFSFERYRGISARVLKEKVAAIETPDAGRVRFRLKQPWPDFMTVYATPASKVGEDGFVKAYQEKKLKNIISGLSGIFGNAATRMEPFVISGGAYAYGGYPDIDGLFREQAGELDPKKREATLHRIQQLIKLKAK